MLSFFLIFPKRTAQRDQKGVASLQRKRREKELHSEGEQERKKAAAQQKRSLYSCLFFCFLLLGKNLYCVIVRFGCIGALGSE